MVDFQAVREIPHASPGGIVVGVSNDHDTMSTVNELGRELVYVTFYATGLWVEEVGDHGDIVRHGCGLPPLRRLVNAVEC